MIQTKQLKLRANCGRRMAKMEQYKRTHTPAHTHARTHKNTHTLAHSTHKNTCTLAHTHTLSVCYCALYGLGMVQCKFPRRKTVVRMEMMFGQAYLPPNYTQTLSHWYLVTGITSTLV